VSELEALKLAVSLYFSACEPSGVTYAVYKTQAQLLRESADKLEACEKATKALKEKAK